MKVDIEGNCCCEGTKRPWRHNYTEQLILRCNKCKPDYPFRQSGIIAEQLWTEITQEEYEVLKVMES